MRMLKPLRRKVTLRYEDVRNQLPTIPEYYMRFLGKEDLNVVKSVCCPFHNEQTPSFVYNAERGTCRCYGKCGTGGDVVKLHQMNKRFTTYEEALEDLCFIYGVQYKVNLQREMNKTGTIETENNEKGRLISKLNVRANTVDRYLQLDYVVSKYPINLDELKDLMEEWKSE